MERAKTYILGFAVYALFVWFITTVQASHAQPSPELSERQLDIRITELERKVAGMQKQITLLHATKVDK